MRERGSLDELFPPFVWLRRAAPTQAQDVERVWKLYRNFGKEVVAPAALALDEAQGIELDNGQRELLGKACRWRLFGATLPVAYGGLGWQLLGILPGLEELARHCSGIANLVSVHGLGLALVGATGNLRILGELCERLVASEARGEPELIATAATEPSAGTDVENIELLGLAKLGCRATPVNGGYVLTGRKVFISNGSLARHIIVLMPTDPAAPAATMKAFWVRSDSPGFAVENVESKMGQRACPAATLGFTDCFVPERDCIGRIGGRELDLVLGSTRGAVAAYGAGIASGALERAVTWARHVSDERGRQYLDAQWVKQRIAEIQQCAWQARAAYWSAAAANEGFGLSSLMAGNRHQAQHWLPRRFVDTRTTRTILASGAVGAVSRFAVGSLPEWRVSLAAAWGAAAKVSASNLAVHACELALEITGSDGLRRELGLEKLLRDAKLLQIYEGTNELNRLELFTRVTGGSLVSNPPASGLTAALEPGAALAARRDDPELNELVRTAERWLASRAAPPQNQGTHQPSSAVSSEDHAELMALGAPQLAGFLDDEDEGATAPRLAQVLRAFGRRAPSLGTLLLAHWLATALIRDASDRPPPDMWHAFPLYEWLWDPSHALRWDGAAKRIHGRVPLVVGASHAEWLLLPIEVEGSSLPGWCRLARQWPGVGIGAPAQTHGLAGTGACDVEVDVKWAEWPTSLGLSSPEPSMAAPTRLPWATACAVALGLGVLEESAALTTEHVTHRWQGGRALLGHDAVAEMLADLSADLTTSSNALSTLLEPSLNAPVRLGLLLQARAALLRGTDIGIRALGGYGYLASYGQEERHRNARQICEILGSTTALRLRLPDLLGGRHAFAQ